MLVADRATPLAEARADGYGLGLYAGPLPPTDRGWRPAVAPARDSALLEQLLGRAAAAAGSRRVGATWMLELHAWHVAGAAVGALLVHGAMPPFDGMWLRDDEDAGWPNGVAIPGDGWKRATGVLLAHRFQAHLAPLVCRLSAERAAKPLWRCAADRLGQATLWCGEAFGDRRTAWALGGEALEALGQPARFELRDGRPARRRAGCCLSHRCDPPVRCEDCPVG